MKVLSKNLNTSLKRLKRDIENELKYDKTDINAFFEKFKLEKTPIIPLLEREFKLANSMKNKEFGYLTSIFLLKILEI